MRRILVALMAPLLLGGCLLSPGKFDSELQLLKNGTFAFTYNGEIQMLALSQLAEMAAKEESFEAECYDEEFDPRDCTQEETAEQRAEWDAGAEERMAKKSQQAKMMRAFLGGIDPSDPDAARELAARLERQRGWRSVTYKGEGLFDVAFEISGTIDHDFVFPTIEGMPGGNAFVNVNLRDGGQIRVDAPGFAAQPEGSPMGGGMSLATLAAMSKSKSEGKTPPMVLPEGTFTLVTDGRILANNTDEGPVSHATGQALTWQIGPGMNQAPTALIGF